MRGWFGDLVRLSWGLIYWNARKSLFRLRKARGAAPCQHPSDSGKAGETACEACAPWRSTRRFHRLCPLIATAPGGRRVCSVSAPRVRPFWGRALLFYGAGLAGLALCVDVGAFAAFRAIGYRVPVRVLAWPPAWRSLHQARADYFYRAALRAFSAGDVRQTYLALTQVYTLDPSNTGAALLLAQFMQVANPAFSDSVYSRLVQRHGPDFESIAQSWLRALLSRGDFRGAGALSAGMLRSGAVHVAAWTQGVLFCERMDGDVGEADRLLSGDARLPSEARSALALSRAVRRGSDAERASVAALSLGSDNTAFEVYTALTFLIRFGRAGDAVGYLDGPSGGSLLVNYDRESLRLDAYAAAGWGILERKEIANLMDQGTSDSAATLVAAHLIRHPDAESAARFFAMLDRRPLPPTAANAGAHMALLCMAGVNGLPGRMDQEADALRQGAGGRFAALARVRDFFGGAGARNPASFLPLLPQMPLEAVYALISLYAAPAADAPDPRARPPGG
jgi:hypothetical protein